MDHTFNFLGRSILLRHNRVFLRLLSRESTYRGNEFPEIYKGISRKTYPKWGGWETIDELLDGYVNPTAASRSMDKNGTLQSEVWAHYEILWNQTHADVIEEATQNWRVACEYFSIVLDFAPETGVFCLQRTLNAVNRGGSTHPKLPVDGTFSPSMARYLKRYSENQNTDPLVLWLAVFHGAEFAKRAGPDNLDAHHWAMHTRIEFA